MKSLTSLILVICFSLVSSAALARTAVLVEPKFEVQASSVEWVENAAIETLSSYGWVITGKENHSIAATYTNGAVSASIVVHCADKAVQIEYIDSQKMHYEEEEGERRIHGNYNRWMGNLEKQIQIYLNKAKYLNKLP